MGDSFLLRRLAISGHTKSWWSGQNSECRGREEIYGTYNSCVHKFGPTTYNGYIDRLDEGIFFYKDILFAPNIHTYH